MKWIPKESSSPKISLAAKIILTPKIMASKGHNNNMTLWYKTLLFMCSCRGSGKHGCCYVSLKPKRVQELNKQPSHYKMHSSLVHSILHNMQFVQMIEDMPLRLIVFQCQYIFSSTHSFHTLFCVCCSSSVEHLSSMWWWGILKREFNQCKKLVISFSIHSFKPRWKWMSLGRWALRNYRLSLFE